MRAVEALTASTDEGAAALGTAANALHRWIDSVVVHGAPSPAAALDTLGATTRGVHACPAMRVAYTELAALQSRLQPLCEELLRLRRQSAERGEAVGRFRKELIALRQALVTARSRIERAEAAIVVTEEQRQRAQAIGEEASSRAEALHKEVEASKAAQRQGEAACAHACKHDLGCDLSRTQPTPGEVATKAELEARRHASYTLVVQLSDALYHSGEAALACIAYPGSRGMHPGRTNPHPDCRVDGGEHSQAPSAAMRRCSATRVPRAGHGNA